MSDLSVNLRDWIGREQVRDDQVTIAPLVALSATLDRDDPTPRAGDELPPLWHWLFFQPHTPTRELSADGHAPLGGFMPPVGLPRRMWAGSRLTFEHAPRVGESMRRVSRVADVTEKTGASGRLVFVTVEHTIHTPRGVAIREAQDLVYRDIQKSDAPGAPGAPGASSAATRTDSAHCSDASFTRTIIPDPVLLFRYSALTFNSHRIHYDRRHVTEVEGYPGLLVHGPLIATLLLDLVRRERPDAVVREFHFRAQRPLFDSAPFSVNGRDESAGRVHLWATDGSGQMAVEGAATLA